MGIIGDGNKIGYFLLCFFILFTCVIPLGCGNKTPQWMSLVSVDKNIEPIPFLQDHAAGLEIAQQEKKPILAFFSVPNNTGSQRMLEIAFCDDEIRHLAKRFVCIHIDGSKEPALCEMLQIINFPTVLLSDYNSGEVRRIIGNQTPDQLAVQMHVLLQTTAMKPTTVVRK